MPGELFTYYFLTDGISAAEAEELEAWLDKPKPGSDGSGATIGYESELWHCRPIW